eukprot:scaffold122520_cov22-Tisochrysis_lutea.AAC.1
MLGNEGHGMTPRQMALCDKFVYISQYGEWEERKGETRKKGRRGKTSENGEWLWCGVRGCLPPS